MNSISSLNKLLYPGEHYTVTDWLVGDEYNSTGEQIQLLDLIYTFKYYNFISFHKSGSGT